MATATSTAREEPRERWSRACGSGNVGYSGHVNAQDYRGGVLMGNWREEDARRVDTVTGRHLLGLGGQFGGPSMYTLNHDAEGRVGADLAASYVREDMHRKEQTLSKELVFKHGSFFEGPVECLSTLNQLAHGEKQLGEPRVQQYLWAGNKHNDLAVPLSTIKRDLVSTQHIKWHQQEHDNAFTTTSRAASIAAVLGAAEEPAKRQSLAPTTGTGIRAYAGHVSKGPFVAEYEKDWYHIGLRT